MQVKEIFWLAYRYDPPKHTPLTFIDNRWKHAATCHHGSTIEGERDVFVEDNFYQETVRNS